LLSTRYPRQSRLYRVVDDESPLSRDTEKAGFVGI
jgi:hypothetical protein